MSFHLNQKLRDLWLLETVTQLRVIRALTIPLYAKVLEITPKEAQEKAQQLSTEFLTHFLAEAVKHSDE